MASLLTAAPEQKRRGHHPCRLSHHQLLLSFLLSHTTHAFVLSLLSPAEQHQCSTQCPNDCAGADGKVCGKCDGGKCICNVGWTGLDCGSPACPNHRSFAEAIENPRGCSTQTTFFTTQAPACIKCAPAAATLPSSSFCNAQSGRAAETAGAFISHSRLRCPPPLSGFLEALTALPRRRGTACCPSSAPRPCVCGRTAWARGRTFRRK